MAEHVVTFAHSIGDSVRVKAIEMMGRVDALMLGPTGIEYRIVYWNDGQRCTAWLYAWEVAA